MSGAVWKWSPERVEILVACLGRATSLPEGLRIASDALGWIVTRSGADDALKRAGRGTAASHLKGSSHVLASPLVRSTAPSRDTERMRVAPPSELPDDSDASSPAPHEKFAALVDLVKKQSRRGGISLEHLCDELDLSPRAARSYLEDARDVGITIEVAHEKLLFRAPEPSPSAPAVSVTLPDSATTAHRIGVFSDMHFGSRYCLREQFMAFVHHAYDRGVRDFFCPGDSIEGCYRHAQFERSCESLDDQQNEYLDALPALPGMRVFFIDGNHCFTFTEKTGVESGRNLIRLARERGRNDLHFFGSRGALVQYGQTRIELWHPKKGAAYALSYQIQNHIRDTAPERLPHILLTGHTHQYVKFRRSNVWGFYCGTFQHGDAPYGRSIGGDVSMGGLIIDWEIDEDGVVRELADTFRLARHEAKRFDVAV